MNLIPVLNKTSPRPHIDSELDVLGVPRKHMKYVVDSSKRKKIEKNKNSSHKLLKLQSTNFGSQGILGIDIIGTLHIIIIINNVVLKHSVLNPYHSRHIICAYQKVIDGSLASPCVWQDSITMLI